MLLWLLACTSPCDSAASPVCGCAEPELVLGDGAEPFKAFQQGQEAMIVHGPQGGWHVWASVQVRNTDPFLQLHYTIDTVPDQIRVSDNLYFVQMTNWKNCVGEIYEIFGYLDVTPMIDGDRDAPPELLVGRTLHLDMTITDSTDRSDHAEVDVVGIPDPKDVGGLDSGDTGS